MAEAVSLDQGDWRRLSPWSILHFSEKTIVQNIIALLYAGGPATFGASRWGSTWLAWVIPVVLVMLVLISATLTYFFYRYRILEDSVQVRRGMLFRKHLNLTFQRMQNISIEHPFYYRPLGRVTLKIDGAGAKDEEVNVAGLSLDDARSAREFIVRQKNRLAPQAGVSETDMETPEESVEGEPFFDRSLADLIIHGLTNNRSFIVVGALLGFLFQSGVNPADVAERLGIDFDVVVAGLSLVQLAILVVVSFIAAIGIIALLSVLVSIFTYYGFSMYRTQDSWTIKRGLLTKHEIHVKKSRIQTITLRQDWLDRVLGRRNVIFERISHSSGQNDPMAAQKRRIFVPSVRIHETERVIGELMPGYRVEEFDYTPISIRFFYKQSAILSAIYLAVLAFVLVLPNSLTWIASALLVLWPLHLFIAYLRWRCGGLAVVGDVVIVRSGTIGIDYRLFPADKLQDVTHIQSLLMRRHALSTVRFHTASAAIKVPHMPSNFIRDVVNFCVYRVETSSRSWM